MENRLIIYNIKQFSIFFLISVIVVFSCKEEKYLEPYCQISTPVKTDEFFIGCTIPISVSVSDGINSEAQVQLFINDQDMGFIPSAPYIYYWNTEGQSIGEQIIKAIYTSESNSSVSEELIIDLIPLTRNCPSVVIDIDGNSYSVVQIGNQCWMRENLKTTHYPNGESLINGIDSLVGVLPNSLPGYYFAYGRDITNSDSFGLLYTWTTAMKGNFSTEDGSTPIQGICPDGWHMPSVKEWRTMLDFVGGLEVAGAKLKDNTDTFWPSNEENMLNMSGFTALPGGCRVYNGSYVEKGTASFFWTATETIPNHAYHIYLIDFEPKAFILGEQDSKRFAYSIRCIMD
ncbi:MAG: hypothetical protein GY705_01395 [Bacteroidetes bacterium]|nr:hypothetical protein [Bacteroidota bacterium]